MASLTELESCGVPARVAQAIFAQAGLKEAEKRSGSVGESRLPGDGVFDSDEYPPLLKQIPDAPLLLYVRGDVKVLSQLCGGDGRHAAAHAPMAARWRTGWRTTWRRGNW